MHEYMDTLVAHIFLQYANFSPCRSYGQKTIQKQCKNDPKTMRKNMRKRCKNVPTTIQKRTCRDGRFKDRFRTYYFYRSKIWLSLKGQTGYVIGS